MKRRLALITILNFCLLGLTIGYITGYLSSTGNPTPRVTIDQWQREGFDRAQRSTVSISTVGHPDRRSPLSAAGSGVIIDPQGYILTNEHIVNQAMEIHVILYDKRRYNASCIGASVRDDLAVLKIDAADLTAIEIGPVDQLCPGMPVAALGNPLDTASDGQTVVTFGLISRLGQRLSSSIDPQNSRFYDNMIQTDAKTLPGNSGGPLINTAGQMIGLNTALGIGAETAKQFGFAMLLDTHTLNQIDRLRQSLPIQHAFLGIQPISIDYETGRSFGLSDLSGAQVNLVMPNTPAWEAGIRNGDIIREIDGQTIHSPDDLLSHLHRCQPEQAVSIKLIRKNQNGTQKIEIIVNLICRNVLLTSERIRNRP